MELACFSESSQSVDLWLLKGLAAVEQHVGVRGLHKAVLDLCDQRVVKTVPGPGQDVVAQSRVVTHVQITCMVLEKERVHLQEAGLSSQVMSQILHLQCALLQKSL